MQIVDLSEESNMYKRSLFYFASLYYTQLKKGQKYKALHPAITIKVLVLMKLAVYAISIYLMIKEVIGNLF